MQPHDGYLGYLNYIHDNGRLRLLWKWIGAAMFLKNGAVMRCDRVDRCLLLGRAGMLLVRKCTICIRKF